MNLSGRRRPTGGQLTQSNKNKNRKICVNPRLFFDMLSDNCLEMVVRFFSDYPRSEAWSRYVRIEDMTELCGVMGGLSTFVASRFTTLSIADLTNFSFSASLAHWHYPILNVLVSPTAARARDFILLQKILHPASNSFHTLIIRDPSNVDLGFLESCAGPVEHSTNSNNDSNSNNVVVIRSLSIAYEGKALIEKFGIHLRVLQLGISPPIRAIPTHCLNLRELVLNELDAEYREDLNNNNLWQHMGRTLESLSVNFCFPCTHEIVKIQKYCRKLKNVRITYPSYDRNAYSSDEEEATAPEGYIALAEALASYGAQLEGASLIDEVPAEQLEIIARACPNVKLDVELQDESFLLPTLTILGRLLNGLKVLSLTLNTPTPVIDDLTQGWNACPNIRKIHMIQRLYSLRDVRQITESPKPLLKYIKLHLSEETDPRACMNALAQRTGGLEEIELNCYSPPPATFNQIVERNCHSLTEATICVRYSNSHSQQQQGEQETSIITKSNNTMIDIATTFLEKAPALTSLLGSDATPSRSIASIRDLCHRNRHHRVVVSLLGHHYLC